MLIAVDHVDDAQEATIKPAVDQYTPTAGAVLKIGTLGITFMLAAVLPDGIYTVAYS